MTSIKQRTIPQRSEILRDLHNCSIISDTREIWLCGDPSYNYDEIMIDQLSANTFIRNLRFLNDISDETILIHMISNGGDWNYGMAIYDAIKASLSETVILAYAHARSMSSVIPQAATYRVMMPNADFLIHWGSFGVEGNHTSCMAEAEQAAKMEDIMLDCYIGRCLDTDFWQKKWNSNHSSNCRKYLRDIMDRKQEVYFTARESVDMGFMDAVLGDTGYETMEGLR